MAIFAFTFMSSSLYATDPIIDITLYEDGNGNSFKFF